MKLNFYFFQVSSSYEKEVIVVEQFTSNLLQAKNNYEHFNLTHEWNLEFFTISSLSCADEIYFYCYCRVKEKEER